MMEMVERGGEREREKERGGQGVRRIVRVHVGHGGMQLESCNA